MKSDLQKMLVERFGKDIKQLSNEEIYYGLLEFTKNAIGKTNLIQGEKKVYYISSEFLIGKLLSNNLINLEIYDEVAQLLNENGKSLSAIEEIEPEPSLGNGGLGRLAACFVDSIATLGLPGDGIGLLYHFGLFKQVFEKNTQIAKPNPWLEDMSWVTKTDTTYTVNYGGLDVIARLYEIDVVGFRNGHNKLKLFDIETIDESILEDGISFDKSEIAKNLTLFLYPDDSDEAGHLLRIYQQYFMVSAGAQLILDEVKAKGGNLKQLDKYATIQINDTHPSLVIPELIRLLIKEGITQDEAIAIVSKTTAYTNHTILAEALEKWPLKYLEKVCPQVVDIIKVLDAKVKAIYKSENLQVIDKSGRVHMAHMDIHYSYSVNGVAALHTDILKESELSHFYKIYPEKFNNKTNGITFRRWLMHCNPELTKFLVENIGEGFKVDALELTKLSKLLVEDKKLSELDAIKLGKKQDLAKYVLNKEGITIDPSSIFDIQIKRLHEYKRQQMNALYIVHKYLEIKDGKYPARPITFFFGAKAAPAYIIAQDIIHFILCMQELVNNDPEISKHMKIVMLENYNVTVAEKLIPACDISEQISLASKEASGTGNMKFMLNGAITLGTMDGANVEIAELVGKDNIYIFGKSSDDVIKLYETASYKSKEFYESDSHIKELVDFIISKEITNLGDKKRLERFYNELIVKDWFMTLLDLSEYITVKDQMFKDYEDRHKWNLMQIENISKAGFFSSDRTITDYNENIWKLK